MSYNREAPQGNTSSRGAAGAIFFIVLGILLYGWYFGGWFSGVTLNSSSSIATGSSNVAGLTAQVPRGMMPCDRINTNANKLCMLAKHYASERVTNPSELHCLDELWNGESGWDATRGSYNPQVTSGGNAYGIPQALDKLQNYPYKYDDWKAQVDWGLTYIGHRYNGSPCEAWNLWLSRSPHWY